MADPDCVRSAGPGTEVPGNNAHANQDGHHVGMRMTGQSSTESEEEAVQDHVGNDVSISVTPPQARWPQEA